MSQNKARKTLFHHVRTPPHLKDTSLTWTIKNIISRSADYGIRCKSTTFFSYDQIFYEKSFAEVHFFDDAQRTQQKSGSPFVLDYRLGINYFLIIHGLFSCCNRGGEFVNNLIHHQIRLFLGIHDT